MTDPSTELLGDHNRPVFSGPKGFVRVFNEEGSYKTLLQPDDTMARYLYGEIGEKFNMEVSDDHRLFLVKNGLGKHPFITTNDPACSQSVAMARNDTRGRLNTHPPL